MDAVPAREIGGSTGEHSVEDLSWMLNRARSAAAAWGALPVKERVSRFPGLSRYLTEHADEIASEISKVTGKTFLDALATEVIPGAVAAGYYHGKTAGILRPRRLRGGGILFFNKSAVLQRVPFGVVGIISPWNYPFSIPFHEVLMALAAGNAVILKVASNCTAVGDLIETIIREAGFPEGLFSHLRMKGSLAGPAFIDAGIDKLFFTGSVPVGKELMKKASERLTPVCFELGGMDAMLVLEDANLERAAAGAVWAGISNCGQSCGGVSRIYIMDAVYDRFVGLLGEKVRNLRQGRGDSFDTDFGPLITASQFESVSSNVRDALEKGARVVAESPAAADQGLYHPAVVLENVRDDMIIMHDETFGPVMTVDRVRSLEEAVSKANSGSFGLTASVWTGNRKRGTAVASRLLAGTVTVNDHLMSHGIPQTPWGGFKESGIGRTHGPLGLQEMTQPRVIVDELLPWMRTNIFWHPYGKRIYHRLRGALVFLFGKGLIGRVRGGLGVVALFAGAMLPAGKKPENSKR